MILRRKRSVVAALAVVAILLFVLHSTQSFPFGHHTIQFKEYSHWNHAPIHFPLDKLRTFKSQSARALPKVQYDFKPESDEENTERRIRRKAVKKAFAKCWDSYRKYAWMKDELKPVSGSFDTTFGGWAATLVDALDTLAIMGMKTELDEAIDAVGQIDFSTSLDEVINVFETNIRYLGGLLAAYDLVGDPRLLKKAIEVGEMLLVAFDTPNHMPLSRWHWMEAANGTEQVATDSMVVAELGSFTLEFVRLSQLTGDMRWYDLVARIMDIFAKQASTTNIPGLWPLGIDPQHEVLNAEADFGFGAMADSLYEYFPKVYALVGGRKKLYKKLYTDSMEAADKHLFFRPMTPDNLDILVSGNARAWTEEMVDLVPQLQHLSCFTGGMLGLGGRLFGIEDHVETGRKLTEGCIWAYNATTNGVMPEIVDLLPCGSKEVCQWNESAWHEAVGTRNYVAKTEKLQTIIHRKRLAPGFVQIGDPSYLLRPEAIESVFILYRITGDKYFQDAAWKMFTAVQGVTETRYGNSAVYDVTAPKEQMRYQNKMESFWLGETLKYFYLIFCDSDVISLDDYVFNTEAHPFLRPR